MGGGSSKFDGGSMGELKMLSKNTCEGVDLIVKLWAISLQASKFTKNKLLHTYFSRILARFSVIIYCALKIVCVWKPWVLHNVLVGTV